LRKKYTQLYGAIATYRLFSGKISGKPRATPAFLTSQAPCQQITAGYEKHAAQRPEKGCASHRMMMLMKPLSSATTWRPYTV
jgi:hypothetical protein